MRLVSTAFQNGGEIPSQYTCDGANTNPPLEFQDIPGGTRSLALIIDDPDSLDGDWTHWILWNIHPEYANIHENEIPHWSIEGVNDFGNNGYGGPCPGSGTHHYRFRGFALSSELMLNQSTNKEYLLNAMHGLIIEEAELIGTYIKLANRSGQ